MSAPSSLTDKVYDALRGATQNPHDHELRLTHLALTTTDVFMHIGLLSGQKIFTPGLRYQHILRSLRDKYQAIEQAHGKENFQDYCITLSKAYYPDAQKSLACHPKAEIAALIEPVMAFYYPSLMEEKKDDHTRYFQKNMVTDLASRLDRDATVSYYNQPDFGVTHLKNVVDKQPYRQATSMMGHMIDDVFDDFRAGYAPVISSKTQSMLASYYMIARADFFVRTAKADCIQFKIHADTTRFTLTASGPFFDQHIQSFKENGFNVSTHHGPVPDHMVWHTQRPYYTIS